MAKCRRNSGCVSSPICPNMTLFKKVLVVLLACSIDFVRCTGCEKEGPCGADNFCSKYSDRCRPCQDITAHCRNRTKILSQYPYCDAFCFQMELEKTTSLLSEQIVALDAAKAELKRLNDTLIREKEIELEKTTSLLSEQIVALDASKAESKWLNDTLIREKENCAKTIAAKNVYILVGLLGASGIANAVFIVILIQLCKKKNPGNGTPQANLNAAEFETLLKTEFNRVEQAASSEGYATGDSSLQATPPPTERHSHLCDKTTSMEHIHIEDTQCHCLVRSLALPGN